MFGFRKKEKNTVFLPEGTLPRARRRENAFASARAAEARMERARRRAFSEAEDELFRLRAWAALSAVVRFSQERSAPAPVQRGLRTRRPLIAARPALSCSDALDEAIASLSRLRGLNRGE